MLCILTDSKDKKNFKSKDYSYIFDKNTGMFARWGKTEQDDPQFAPYPEILDIEVTKSCNGVPDENGVESPCKFCYKANVLGRENMNIDTFKKIIDKFDIKVMQIELENGKKIMLMPEEEVLTNNGEKLASNLTEKDNILSIRNCTRIKKIKKINKNMLLQIAIGADATGLINPDLFKMMEYTRSKGVVPNITLANISDEVADKVVKLCGAVAVSRYDNKNICYDSVKRLTDRGLKQVNIHQLLHSENFEQVKETILDRLDDTRLDKLNAIVFLSVKRKNRGMGYQPMPFDKYKELVDLALEKGVAFGMDSCSAHKFLNSIRDRSNYKQMEMMVEPCEATCFSSYINTFGEFFACSFGEQTGQGINVLEADSFSDVWTSKYTTEFREKLLKNNRNCILFEDI